MKKAKKNWATANAKKVADRLAVVYSDPQLLVREAADRWTTENMGMMWPETTWRDAGGDPDVREADLFEEYRDWLGLARLCIEFVQEKALPLTLASMEIAFREDRVQLERLARKRARRAKKAKKVESRFPKITKKGGK